MSIPSAAVRLVTLLGQKNAMLHLLSSSRTAYAFQARNSDSVSVYDGGLGER